MCWRYLKYTFPQFSICKWSRSLKVGQAGEVLDGFPLPKAALPVPMLLCVKNPESKRQEYHNCRGLITMKRTLSSQTALPTDSLCEEPGQRATVNTEGRRCGERCAAANTDVRRCAERFKGNSSCPVSGFVDRSSNWSPPRTWVTAESYLAHNSSLQTQRHIGTLLICSVFLDV